MQKSCLQAKPQETRNHLYRLCRLYRLYRFKMVNILHSDSLKEAEMGRKVLIIEDDKAVRFSIKELLIMEDYQVSEAENGQEGLEKLRHSGAPCAILLDWMMPTMNGQEFLNEKKKTIEFLISPSS